MAGTGANFQDDSGTGKGGVRSIWESASEYIHQCAQDIEEYPSDEEAAEHIVRGTTDGCGGVC